MNAHSEEAQRQLYKAIELEYSCPEERLFFVGLATLMEEFADASASGDREKIKKLSRQTCYAAARTDEAVRKYIHHMCTRQGISNVAAERMTSMAGIRGV